MSFFIGPKWISWMRAFIFSLHAVNDMFERTVSWFWFKCVKLTDQDYVTMNYRGCETIQLCRIHLNVPSSKLKDFIKCRISLFSFFFSFFLFLWKWFLLFRIRRQLQSMKALIQNILWSHKISLILLHGRKNMDSDIGDFEQLLTSLHLPHLTREQEEC